MGNFSLTLVVLSKNFHLEKVTESTLRQEVLAIVEWLLFHAHELVVLYVISSELFAVQICNGVALLASYIFLCSLLKHGTATVPDHLNNLINCFVHSLP